jgi:ABC-type multidrug transport system fused ATPase/permease subunit
MNLFETLLRLNKRYFLNKDKQSTTLKLLIRLCSYAFAYPYLLLGFYITTALSSIISTYNPSIETFILYLLSQPDIKSRLVQAFLMRFVSELVLALSNNLKGYLDKVLTIKIEGEIKKDFCDKLLKKDTAFYDNKKVGELVSRLNPDVSSLKKLAIGEFANLLSQIIKIASCLTFNPVNENEFLRHKEKYTI